MFVADQSIGSVFIPQSAFRIPQWKAPEYRRGAANENILVRRSCVEREGKGHDLVQPTCETEAPNLTIRRQFDKITDTEPFSIESGKQWIRKHWTNTSR